ncbi:MAG: hypothetical protein WEA58_13815 [Balneolaceae bacterium]
MEKELDNEQIRVFIDSITEQFGFEELSKVKDTSNNFESVQIKTRFWQRSDLHIKLNVHSELFTKNDIFEIK